MKNGDTLRGPRSLSSSAVSAMPDRPPIPEPIRVPVAHLSSSVEGCQSASSSAWRAAAIAKTMKSSTLRCSFGSIHWSGSKVPSLPSPRGMLQAIRAGRSLASKLVMGPAPLAPASRRAQLGSTPQASGVTMPSPVTTTRRIGKLREAMMLSASISPWGRSGALRREELHGIADRHDRLGRIIRNLDAELFLEGHHELDGVEAVRAQVFDEVGAVDDLLGLDAEVLDHDLLHALGDIAH